MSSENFAQLFKESIEKIKLQSGSIVEGTVVRIDDDFVLINAGLKSESLIPIEQFMNENGEIEIKAGDTVEVALEVLEDGFGTTRLSREKAKRQESWTALEKACEAGTPVMGFVSSKVKGGFTVELNGIKAFLPGSLVDVRPIRNPEQFEGKEIELKVIKIDAKRNNVIVSRRSVLEAERTVDRDALLESLREGMVVKGIVKNLTDYGAFIDLGGVDGLLHITDISYKRLNHPSEVMQVGDEITVKVLKFDRERSRVSLGLKQLGDDPWVNIKERYPKGEKITGRVTNVTDYGCFVEVEDGVEGLVHVSEMDWTNKNIHPSKVVEVDQQIDVVVLDIDEERRRISLGIKQCKPDPWEAFAERHQKGDKITGKIKSITDFGIFIGLDGGIDGLIHLSDISWGMSGEEAIRNYKKGQEIDAMVLAVDPERERVSLGIKQLDRDPFIDYINTYGKGSMVEAEVVEVDAKKAKLHLGEGVEGCIRASEMSEEKIDDLRQHLQVGQTIKAAVASIDRKNRIINVTLKANSDISEDSDADEEDAE